MAGLVDSLFDAVSSGYTALQDPSDSARALIWYNFSRLLSLVACWQLWTNAYQILPICGSGGVYPIAEILPAFKRDFPSWRRFVYFPTVFWINASDTALQLWLFAGGSAALYGAVFGPSLLTQVIAWVAMWSHAMAAHCGWPWDTLLYEATFLSFFMPFSRTVPPSGLVCWAYRWLLFRLMHGFGRLKFTGQHPKNDKLYLKAFQTFQPMPNLVSYYMQLLLPDSVHRSMMWFFWFAEIPAPFLFLCWGRLRLLGAVTTIMLQVGIEITGSFGYFNVLTMIMCVPLFDIHTSFFGGGLAGSVADSDWSWTSPVIWWIVPYSCITLLFNSWISQAWYFMPSLRWLDWPLRNIYRYAMPFFTVCAYGVFPPHPFPAERFVPVIEGSVDGENWKEYEYMYMSSAEHSRPPLAVAPYHPRMEYMTMYCGSGQWDSIVSLAPNPYLMSRPKYHQRWAARLLESGANVQPVRDMFKVNPFPDPNRPPKYVRVRNYMLTATNTNGNNYWRRVLLHQHGPVMTLEAAREMWAEYPPRLDQWSPDMPDWRARWINEPANRSKWAKIVALDSSVVPDSFWSDFVAKFQPPALSDFMKSAAEIAAEPLLGYENDANFKPTRMNHDKFCAFMTAERQRFLKTFPSKEMRQSIEAVFGFVTWAMVDRMDTKAVSTADPLSPTTQLKYHSWVYLCAQTAIRRGKEQVSKYLSDPAEAKRLTEETFVPDDGTNWYYAILIDYDRATKTRLAGRLAVIDIPSPAEKFLPGYMSTRVSFLLSRLFIGSSDPNSELYEHVPNFKYDENGLTLQPVGEPYAGLPCCRWPGKPIVATIAAAPVPGAADRKQE